MVLVGPYIQWVMLLTEEYFYVKYALQEDEYKDKN